MEEQNSWSWNSRRLMRGIAVLAKTNGILIDRPKTVIMYSVAAGYSTSTAVL
jgi:hypothetical protein